MTNVAHLPGRDPATGQFTSGNPGRPLGAVGKMSARAIHGIFKDFEANHEDLLQHLRVNNPTVYAQLLMKLIAKSAYHDAEMIEPLRADPVSQENAAGLRMVKTGGSPRSGPQAVYEARKAASAGADNSACLSENITALWAARKAEQEAYQALMAEDAEDEETAEAEQPEPAPIISPLPPGVRSEAELDTLVGAFAPKPGEPKVTHVTLDEDGQVAAIEHEVPTPQTRPDLDWDLTAKLAWEEDCRRQGLDPYGPDAPPPPPITQRPLNGVPVGSSFDWSRPTPSAGWKGA